MESSVPVSYAVDIESGLVEITWSVAIAKAAKLIPGKWMFNTGGVNHHVTAAYALNGFTYMTIGSTFAGDDDPGWYYSGGDPDLNDIKGVPVQPFGAYPLA